MAQTKKSTSKSSKSRGNGARARSQSSSTTAASKRSNSKRGGSNGTRAKGTSTARKRTSTTRPRPQARSTAQRQTRADSIKGTAIHRTKGVGQAVVEAASRAKTPLIVGGTALVGAAAGAVARDRLASNRSKSPLKRLRGVSIPNPAAKLNPGKLDLDTVKSTAERITAYGQQASDVAAAVEKTRKKHK